MRILITGGCGLVGTNLAKFYRNQADVLVVDNFERSSLLSTEQTSLSKKFYNRNFLKKLDIDIANLDISRPDAWETISTQYGRFDHIYHMAAFVGVSSSYKAPHRAWEINAQGTALMLEKARAWGASVVYPSTFKVYAASPSWSLQDNRWRWNNADWDRYGYPVGVFGQGNRSPYGVAKYAGELLCQEYARSYALKVGIFRMSNIYGEHQISFEEQGWLTWFILSNIRNWPINIFGDGCQVRDLLYVTDLIKAFDSFLTSDIKLGIWNIGGGPKFSTSLNEAIEEIEMKTKKLFSFLNYYDWRTSDLKVYTSDIRSAQEDLKWAPTITPNEGMARVTKWILNTEEIW